MTEYVVKEVRVQAYQRVVFCEACGMELVRTGNGFSNSASTTWDYCCPNCCTVVAVHARDVGMVYREETLDGCH